MKKNMGLTDRVIRVVLGLIIIALGIIYGSWWGVIGLLLLLSAATSRCPAYLPFGISTCKIIPEEKK